MYVRATNAITRLHLHRSIPIEHTVRILRGRCFNTAPTRIDYEGDTVLALNAMQLDDDAESIYYIDANGWAFSPDSIVRLIQKRWVDSIPNHKR